MRGFSGYKQVVGRKRHFLVDTENFLLSVVVHPTNIRDRKGDQWVRQGTPIRRQVLSRACNTSF